MPLAVRSSGVEEDSAEASYAGLFTTVLNVRGDSALLDAVRECWNSAFNRQVIEYSDGQPPRLAVLVQPMVPATAAGVAFTADPVTANAAAGVIDAVTGIGDRSRPVRHPTGGSSVARRRTSTRGQNRPRSPNKGPGPWPTSPAGWRPNSADRRTSSGPRRRRGHPAAGPSGDRAADPARAHPGRRCRATGPVSPATFRFRYHRSAKGPLSAGSTARCGGCAPSKGC